MNKQNWQTYGLTSTGKVRTRNEDNMCLLNKQGLWLVADGAGGHSNGDLASQLTVDAFIGYKTTRRIGTDVRQVIDRLQTANTQLIEHRNKTGKVSASTVSVVVTNGCSAVCIWSGDSPIYRLRNNKITQLSQDHNRVEEFINQGFSATECENIPFAQHLTQALGASQYLCVQTQWTNVQLNDCLLICSDGVTKELSEKEIETTMRKSQYSAESITRSLVTETLSRGARDNTTVISLIIK